jgi:hypothetical protein
MKNRNYNTYNKKNIVMKLMVRTRRFFVSACLLTMFFLIPATVGLSGTGTQKTKQALASFLPATALLQSGCAATSISSGQVVTGSLTSSDCRSTRFGTSHLADYYSFNGSAGQRIDILTTAASFDDFLVVYGPQGQVIIQDNDSGEQSNGWISIQLSVPGRYVLEVTSSYSQITGNYTFRLNSECEIVSISNGQSITASLTESDCASLRFGTGHWADRYSFFGTAKQRIDILTTAASFDDYVTLYGPIGQIIEQDNDSGENANAWISLELPSTGTYTIEFSSSYSFIRGNYQFRLNAECAVLPISNGQTVNGNLAESDCASLRFGTGHWADRYFFNAVAGQQVEIITTAASFNDYLTLYGPIGQVVAQDNDSGADDKARIFLRLPAAGVYMLEITSSYSFNQGNYSMRLNGAGSVCSYHLSSGNQHFDLPGGNSSVNISADAGCLWTAASNADWIHLTSGVSGTGNGTITYSVASHSGSSRSGTLTIAGQTFTVTQGTSASTAPFIQGASISGKKLFVYGGNFANGATLFINGQRQKKTFNDEANPQTTIVAKKAGNSIVTGTTVTIEVENPDGSRSTGYFFTRP